MAGILTQKWWAILIQGLLMIILSIIIFNNPGTVLMTISLWLGIIVLVTGIIGIISYLFMNKEGRETSSFLWSLIVTIVGLLMVTKIVFTMKAITVLFGLVVAAIGIIIITNSFNEKGRLSWWWIMAILGVIILIMGIASILNLSAGAESISTLLGFSFLFSGIGLVVLSFLKKTLVNKIKERM